MRLHKCRCSFIPQHVVENLARAGVEGARRTIIQSQISRSKRYEKPMDMSAKTLKKQSSEIQYFVD